MARLQPSGPWGCCLRARSCAGRAGLQPHGDAYTQALNPCDPCYPCVPCIPCYPCVPCYPSAPLRVCCIGLGALTAWGWGRGHGVAWPGHECYWHNAPAVHVAAKGGNKTWVQCYSEKPALASAPPASAPSCACSCTRHREGQGGRRVHVAKCTLWHEQVLQPRWTTGTGTGLGGTTAQLGSQPGVEQHPCSHST